MATTEERMQILRMIENKQITAEEGAKLLAAIEEKKLLQADYGGALEKFRRVSKLKKELDRRPPIRRALLTPAGQAARPSGGAAAAPPTSMDARRS